MHAWQPHQHHAATHVAKSACSRMHDANHVPLRHGPGTAQDEDDSLELLLAAVDAQGAHINTGFTLPALDVTALLLGVALQSMLSDDRVMQLREGVHVCNAHLQSCMPCACTHAMCCALAGIVRADAVPCASRMHQDKHRTQSAAPIRDSPLIRARRLRRLCACPPPGICGDEVWLARACGHDVLGRRCRQQRRAPPHGSRRARRGPARCSAVRRCAVTVCDVSCVPGSDSQRTDRRGRRARSQP